MSFNFDEPLELRGKNTNKWDSLEKYYGVTDPDAISMWVADMDFRAPPAVQATMRNIADHGLYTYFGDHRAYLAAITHWMRTRHDWEVDPEHISTTHGMVQAISLCLQAFTKARDHVIVFTPVYHAFMRAIKANDRKVVESELVLRDGRYHMDLDALANTLTGKEKMLLFCSPHNPVARIWSVEEQQALAQFCIDHDILLVADEIHQDLIYPGQRHVMMQNAAPAIADKLITLTSASKTFNLAGEHTSQTTIRDDAMRAKFRKRIATNSISPNRVGLMLTTAAYAHGAEWVDALMTYLDGNRRLFVERMGEIPGVDALDLEATYLAWVNFSGTGMEKAEVIDRVQNRAGVVASHGDSFGAGGDNFLRFNIATRRAILREALDRVAKAFSDLQ